MEVCIGTRDGVYRAAGVPTTDVEQVLDSGNTLRVRTFPAVDGVFAATKTGLYRSADDGRTWENLDVPREEVYSVGVSPDGERLYAGTHPAHLYVSTDRGGMRGTSSKGSRTSHRGTSGIPHVTVTKPTSGVSASIRRRPTA